MARARSQTPVGAASTSTTALDLAGVSRSLRAARRQFSSLITFSPLGIAPLSTAKTADAASLGSRVPVTATRSRWTNPNATAVTLNSVTDTLPAGSAMCPLDHRRHHGEPVVTGQTLTWAGPFSVPATGSVSLHFSVTVSSTPGDYFNNATADAGSATVVATGPTAKITVTSPQTATLHVIKHVVNDSGGTASAANFTLSVSGTSPSPASFPGAESPGTTVTLGAGSYSVSETGPSGYAQLLGRLHGHDRGRRDEDLHGHERRRRRRHGAARDQARRERQRGHGERSELHAERDGTSPNPASFPAPRARAPTVTLGAGSYNVTETGPSGYTASFSADCTGTIAAGQTKTCTVTNDDVAPTTDAARDQARRERQRGHGERSELHDERYRRRARTRRASPAPRARAPT